MSAFKNHFFPTILILINLKLFTIIHFCKLLTREQIRIVIARIDIVLCKQKCIRIAFAPYFKVARIINLFKSPKLIISILFLTSKHINRFTSIQAVIKPVLGNIPPFLLKGIIPSYRVVSIVQAWLDTQKVFIIARLYLEINVVSDADGESSDPFRE